MKGPSLYFIDQFGQRSVLGSLLELITKNCITQVLVPGSLEDTVTVLDPSAVPTTTCDKS